MDTIRPAQSNARRVQEYIDELPAWPDGTSLKSAPMTAMQRLIWSLAAAGKFFAGYVVFMTGVALPLIVRDFHIAAAEKRIVGAASLAWFRPASQTPKPPRHCAISCCGRFRPRAATRRNTSMRWVSSRSPISSAR